jgi:hypothetical protein
VTMERREKAAESWWSCRILCIGIFFLYVFVCGLYMYPELATRESRFFLGLEYTSWISFTIACSFFESTLKATIARSQETSSSSIWGNSLPRQVCPQNSVLYLCFWEYLNISDFTPQNPVTFRPMRHPGVLHSWKRRGPRRWCRKCQTSQSSPSVSIVPDFRARSGEPSKYHGQQYHGKSMAKIGDFFRGFERRFDTAFGWYLCWLHYIALQCLEVQNELQIWGWVKTLVPSEPQNSW